MVGPGFNGGGPAARPNPRGRTVPDRPGGQASSSRIVNQMMMMAPMTSTAQAAGCRIISAHGWGRVQGKICLDASPCARVRAPAVGVGVDCAAGPPLGSGHDHAPELLCLRLYLRPPHRGPWLEAYALAAHRSGARAARGAIPRAAFFCTCRFEGDHDHHHAVGHHPPEAGPHPGTGGGAGHADARVARGEPRGHRLHRRRGRAAGDPPPAAPGREVGDACDEAVQAGLAGVRGRPDRGPSRGRGGHGGGRDHGLSEEPVRQIFWTLVELCRSAQMEGR